MLTLDLTRRRQATDEALAAKAALLDRIHGNRHPAEILTIALVDEFPGRTALVTSFGADSAVLLHLAASVDPSIPVIFVDTGRHFAETLAYRDRLVGRLGLTDLRSIGPTDAEVAAHDPVLALAERDPDACCGFRKVGPLVRALQPFAASISGRKRHQAATRTGLAVFEAEDGQIKINPLAAWNAADIAAYARAHDLPAHPLVADGYPSIGCAPCTSRVEAGEDLRAGRWRGSSKIECGIHQPARALAATRTGS
ncbi:phosphoadenylyl-sulfate reductase [Phreatobacter stygius]|uniref:Adenosine 5'-phosphosulfate reductase n=1 Tax=Phreatobacter stygius TaxID=1940610 RepID=A0A4D7ATW0_9HYPH|nr:phosphoadenylyl-sulfate reductase [Phreatobacter stygius]QCI65014.1 phosphoadenylyl-sulfate reductase [Phreatobacter stygius]